MGRDFARVPAAHDLSFLEQRSLHAWAKDLSRSRLGLFIIIPYTDTTRADIGTKFLQCDLSNTPQQNQEVDLQNIIRAFCHIGSISGFRSN